MNRYPLWKYLLMGLLFVLGLIYALPNLYGEQPAVQISPKEQASVSQATVNQVEQVLQTLNIPYQSAAIEDGNLLVRFTSTDTQLQANDAIKKVLGDGYSVALNLAPETPKWLQAIGAQPMKLGLDLRGGVHFLLDVDVDAVVKARKQADMRSMSAQLRDSNIRYAGAELKAPNSIVLTFRSAEDRSQAQSALASNYPDYVFNAVDKDKQWQLMASITQSALTNIDNYAVDQNIQILTNRVNELGVSEAAVQRQGRNQISVDLPGVQDTARAKNIIGQTATLRFQLVDTEHDAASAVAGNVPMGSTLYTYEGHPLLLKNSVILRGDSITYATATIGEDGRPSVNVRLGGGAVGLFQRETAANIGKLLAVVYVETQLQTQKVNGQDIMTRKQTERVISVATIQSALGNNFSITGLDSMRYAQNLALLLRSGAMAAPVSIIQERTIGPSLGQANIDMGVRSVIIGSLLVFIFMAFYYRVFGLVADMALTLNIIFIIAILSILGAVLTLPGIAGIVLTVGMAVDANVLINERIREELRAGMSPQASIYAGYERAFSTIVDANVTTLIVAIVLFALGSSSVKGFAVTLTVGLLTSMVTSIFFTRGVINLIYGRRTVKKLSIGIHVRPASVRAKSLT